MDQLEVRVGSLEISSNPNPPDENKICINKLCYTSGLKATGVHSHVIQQDCIRPLEGR